MISVILPVYNAENYIEEAISSVLNQSFKNFELIIINDGSTDASLQKIKQFKDKRMILISRKNKGLIKTLNEGLDIAKYEIIARMDADDISNPERFKQQIEVMKNDRIIACGTSVEVFNEHQSRKIISFQKDKEIKSIQLITNPLFHPSTMFRKTDLRYKDYPHLEDYKFFYDLGKKGELFNVKNVLLKYRITSNSITAKNHFNVTKEYAETMKTIIREFHKDIGLKSLEHEADVHFIMMHKDRIQKYPIPYKALEYYMNKLIFHNPFDKKAMIHYFKTNILPYYKIQS